MLAGCPLSEFLDGFVAVYLHVYDLLHALVVLGYKPVLGIEQPKPECEAIYLQSSNESCSEETSQSY